MITKLTYDVAMTVAVETDRDDATALAEIHRQIRELLTGLSFELPGLAAVKAHDDAQISLLKITQVEPAREESL
jgi:hypothetical protein